MPAATWALTRPDHARVADSVQDWTGIAVTVDVAQVTVVRNGVVDGTRRR